MIQRIIFTTCMLLCSTATIAAKWINLDGGGLSHDGAPLGLRIDEDSLVRNGDQATVWMQMWWGTTGSIQNYNSTFDCKQRTSNTNMAFQEGGGKRYPGEARPQMTPIPPNTASEIVLNTVCSKKWFEVWKK